MMYGVDISHHQNENAVREVCKKSDFIITRGTIGTLKEDSKLHIFLPQIIIENIPHGHYCASYSKNEREAEEEADFICDVIEKYKDKPTLPIFYDWEYFSYDYIKNKFGIVADANLVKRMTLAFCKRVQERGYRSGVYLNRDFWNRFYGDKFFIENKDLYIWYARPGVDKPDEFCHIWQYRSNNGHDFGYSGNIDKNKMTVDIISKSESGDMPQGNENIHSDETQSNSKPSENKPSENDSDKFQGEVSEDEKTDLSHKNLIEWFFAAILKILKGE